jgi:Protein of unknown function (DUF4199)
MENTITPAKSGLQYGILFGIVMILELVIGYVMNVDPTSNPMYGTLINILNFLVLPLLFIYLGCTNYKLKINNGFISFGQCLKIGVAICVIAGLIYALFSSGFNILFPEYLEDIYRKSAQMMRKQNPSMSAEELEMGVSMIKKFSNPMIAIPLSIVMFAFIGLIHSLIIGAIVKKDANHSL